jgi:putative endonuclease
MKAVQLRGVERLSPFFEMSPATYRVYLIVNDTGRRYIGISENVTKRLSDHNAGLSKWTAKYRPWILFWTSNEMSLSEARKLENLLKRQKGGNLGRVSLNSEMIATKWHERSTP